ncbi:helix-turn-helix transcriptional regulator [Iamia sp.]|uniref:helix-turn-helix domain-containing protein n=1 Tax=Iamia sp. TaxID=2722710 RepID=UPI002B5BF9C0|nr:helix-turn-helix transcriptional regulator [Iamia sp.]HXH58431.1 helix-turn-helix transcriptional regulator [Iamia sp.]
MARPAGHKLSRSAWTDLVRLTGYDIGKIEEYSGVPAATLRGLVAGRHNASIPVAHKIASAFECHPRTLFPSLTVDVQSEPVAS